MLKIWLRIDHLSPVYCYGIDYPKLQRYGDCNCNENISVSATKLVSMQLSGGLSKYVTSPNSVVTSKLHDSFSCVQLSSQFFFCLSVRIPYIRHVCCSNYLVTNLNSCRNVFLDLIFLNKLLKNFDCLSANQSAFKLLM